MTAADRLIAVWVAWEDQPRSPTTTNRRMDVLAEFGLPCIETHDLIATMRRGGYSVPDAVQTAVNTLAPHHALAELQEAS